MRKLIGAVLRRIRQAQGRTLRDVADAAQVSMPYLSEVERGVKEASSEVLAAICRALGIRLVDLLAEVMAELLRHEPATAPLPRVEPAPASPSAPAPTSAAARPSAVSPAPAGAPASAGSAVSAGSPIPPSAELGVPEPAISDPSVPAPVSAAAHHLLSQLSQPGIAVNGPAQGRFSSRASTGFTVFAGSVGPEPATGITRSIGFVAPVGSAPVGSVPDGLVAADPVPAGSVPVRVVVGAGRRPVPTPRRASGGMAGLVAGVAGRHLGISGHIGWLGARRPGEARRALRPAGVRPAGRPGSYCAGLRPADTLPARRAAARSTLQHAVQTTAS